MARSKMEKALRQAVVVGNGPHRNYEKKEPKKAKDRYAQRIDVRIWQEGENWLMAMNHGAPMTATVVEVELWKQLQEARNGTKA